jgi:hypothetical protein
MSSSSRTLKLATADVLSIASLKVAVTRASRRTAFAWSSGLVRITRGGNTTEAVVNVQV